MDLHGWPRQKQMLSNPEDLVEKVYPIHGTDMSFSANQTEFDYKAAAKIEEINRMDLDAVVMCDDSFNIVPEETHGDQVFLSNDPTRWSKYLLGRSGVALLPDGWRIYGSIIGHGIPSGDGRYYRAFKQTFVYYKGNKKTKWFMDVYDLISENTIQADAICICHVFQSTGDYDPCPKRVPIFSDFAQAELHSRAKELDDLLKNPKAFMDFDECDANFGAYSTRIANGSCKKRSGVWKNFTAIKVLGPDGVVMLTLAICHGCNIAYKTGSGLKNNGTKTLTEHSRKCIGRHHIGGNPQGAPHH